MFLKLILNNRDNQVSIFLLEHVDSDFIQGKINSFFHSHTTDENKYVHRAVLYVIYPSDSVDENTLSKELDNPENAHHIKTWYVESITDKEDELIQFLEQYDIQDILVS